MAFPSSPVIVPTAETFHRMRRAADDAQNNRGSLEFEPGGEGPPAGMLYIENNHGSAVDRFAPLGISGVLITQSDNADEFYNQPTLTGRTPMDEDHDGFAITQEPIADGAIGLAMVAGITPVRLYVVDTADTHAHLETYNDGQLTTGGGSARILWKSGGTGANIWGLVQFPAAGAGSLWWFSLTGSLSGGSAAADLKTMAGDDVTGAVTVEDPVGIFGTLGSSDEGICQRVGEKYYVLQAKC